MFFTVMKVFIIGANGQIGKQLVGLLKAAEGYTPVAMVRKKEQAQDFNEQGVEAVEADLESSVEDIAKAAKGFDAIVFTAGSGGHTGADKTLLIDLDGAVKAMEAAGKAGIERFIMVSALQAHRRKNWNQKIKPYYVAKYYADRALVESNLKYTIIRPGRLLNEPGTGRIKAAENLERASIPREDVARTIMAVLQEENTVKKSFDIIAGETPVPEAIKTI